ncbi:MAG: chorismate synthase [Dehalococcoidales bacterium]|jgi:chorismate synthase|nr:chorismate synthase [Dehalococcoidales bacterium]MDP6221975.1 chorismate synthase [Dehalococcoidales bacterium]MDP7110090.1 chorismate synthase [Dehalococcoidales bacterium]MDP7309628.1 chorismate synthase [Dehalococcoidales bacterium]MDP7409439.1 chorismate synthase [Dehalococcoidales bacterium]
MNNSFGQMFSITSFGESHGRCVGVTIDGCPAGLSLAETDVQKEVDRRRPGKRPGATQRTDEEDKVEIISGIFNGRTTGSPICLLVWNQDIDSTQYEETRMTPRPGHADYTAFVKYGGFNDFRGGGRFSGRITVSYVMAGAVARKLLGCFGIEILAHTVEIGGIKAETKELDDIKRNLETNSLKCADSVATMKMIRAIETAQAEGDSVGGIIEGQALNVPAGLGEPIFDTMEGELAKAIFSIPAVKGIEFGSGFAAARKKGSENNDPFAVENEKIVTSTNNAGGVIGGISNGMAITLRVVFKPTPSISLKQTTINLKEQKADSVSIRGRHDTCVVPRAVPVVESMMAITLCDFALRAGIIPEVLE